MKNVIVPYNGRQHTKFVHSVNINRYIGWIPQQFGEQVYSIRVPLLRLVKNGDAMYKPLIILEILYFYFFSRDIIFSNYLVTKTEAIQKKCCVSANPTDPKF
jgi:hypothetical protein